MYRKLCRITHTIHQKFQIEKKNLCLKSKKKKKSIEKTLLCVSRKKFFDRKFLMIIQLSFDWIIFVQNTDMCVARSEIQTQAQPLRDTKTCENFNVLVSREFPIAPSRNLTLCLIHAK